MIFVISFIKIGPSDEVFVLNKVILCIIILFIFFLIQYKKQPFYDEKLNYLSNFANIVGGVVLLSALFSLVCQDSGMEMFLLFCSILLVSFFLLTMMRHIISLLAIIYGKSRLMRRISGFSSIKSIF